MPDTTLGEMRKQYQIYINSHGSAWTDEERKLIPVMDDSTTVPDVVVKMAEIYTSSVDTPNPIVNMMWRGETGIGKSTGVKKLACLLQRPLLIMSCNSGTETENFLSSFVPTQDKKLTYRPTVEDMLNDPVSIYRYLTDKDKPDATPDDCLLALTAIQTDNEHTGFKLIESPYITALQKGYIVEIQECSRIKDAGVLPGLNAYDQPNARIPLANGSWSLRHPQALCIYTDNIGYAGCRQLDQSVIRRMGAIFDSEITDEMVNDRIKDFEINSEVKEWLRRAWSNARNYCMSQEIFSGSISVVELENWIRYLMIAGIGDDEKIDSGLLWESAECCVISKATNDPEEQKQISSAMSSAIEIITL